MSNALMLAIIGTLRPVPAAATGITVVGSKSTATTVVFGSGVTSQNAVAALPAGCAAGDTVVFSCIAQNFSSFVWGAPSGAAVVLASQVSGLQLVVAVFAYVLTSTDVSAGSVNLPCTVAAGGYSVGACIAADVRRSVSGVPIDVVGALTAGSFGGNVTNDTPVSGITTTKNNDLLQYVLFAAIPGSGSTAVPPVDWSQGDVPLTVNPVSAFTGYKQQVASGAVADINLSVSKGTVSTDKYATLMFALRPKAPSIALTYDLPAAATVGTVYNGSITATLVDGATGPVTITASSLPDGVTAGTQVDNGNGSYTLPIEGTPTTAQTVSIGIGATNGVQSASATQSVVVSAAATGFTDNFTTPASSTNWAMSLQGAAGGAYAFNAGSCVLTPAQSVINSVAMRHAGTFKDAALTVSQSANPTGSLQYLTLSLGTGAVIAYGNGTNWYYTVLKNGYSLMLSTIGNLLLTKSVNGVSTTLGTKTYTGDIRTASHVYELIVTDTGVSAVRDGVTMLTSTDTTYAAGGDILIAQGEYTNGAGGIATVTKVVAS